MIINSKYRPSWWLRNPHLQTLYASKFSKRPAIRYHKERLELSDGDFVDLCWSHKQTGELVLILHGLMGSIASNYAQGAFSQIESVGMRPVFMHWRGCSGEPNRLVRSYHSGETGDITMMVELLKQRFPNIPISIVGYSLGANALLKYLGEQGESSQVRSAIAICPPLVLNVGANKLNTGLAKGYQRYLVGLMKNEIEAKRTRYPNLELPQVGNKIKTFWQIDDVFTAPTHGFNDVHDYYEQCSSRQYLKYIETPTHIIYAEDDPFFTTDVIPSEKELPTAVTLEQSRNGGHVGFIQGNVPFKPDFWLDRRIGEVLIENLRSVV